MKNKKRGGGGGRREKKKEMKCLHRRAPRADPRHYSQRRYDFPVYDGVK